MTNTEALQRQTYLKIGILVGQVNIVEMEINQIIASHYTHRNKIKSFSKDLLYDGSLSLHRKLKLFEEIARVLGINLSKRQRDGIASWRRTRNMMAHGIPGRDDSTNKPALSFNGNYFYIAEEFEKFGKYHDQMVELIEDIKERQGKK